jgi:Plasmid pRiA4b ORF-3-like protein/snRNA-activating protein complex (SNAPc), subunit 3
MRTILQGVRFRHVPSRVEIKRGALLAEPTFDVFHNPNLALDDFQILDARGNPLPTRVIEIQSVIETRLGRHTVESPAFGLSEWFREVRLHYGDSILFTVEDWERGRLRLEHEPASKRRYQEIDRKNRELADLVFSHLEAAPNTYLSGSEAIACAYGQMSDPRGYPGDHWVDVLARDKRMNWDGFQVRYTEDRTPIQIILGGDEWKPTEVRFTPAQGQQVYRFKAALTYQPKLWRRIEIRGTQTLAEFDDTLRSAFNHDRADHLGEFWKRVRRGTGGKFRAVRLGDVNPFGEGTGAGVRVAGLGLDPGDELKYVYDFGDWIEHRITLEGMGAPERNVKYPRVAAKNRPQYRYCKHCEAEGRQTLATWVCLECSERQQRDVLVCRDCLRAHHVDHHADEILY